MLYGYAFEGIGDTEMNILTLMDKLRFRSESNHSSGMIVDNQPQTLIATHIDTGVTVIVPAPYMRTQHEKRQVILTMFRALEE